MNQKLNLINKTFTRWKVRAFVGMCPKTRKSLWEVLCTCGATRIVLGNNLVRGLTHSCGCYKRDRTIEVHTQHGLEGTKFYVTWESMKQRCSNPRKKCFNNYGGRGITVCKKWQAFLGFKEDMYATYLHHCEKYGEKDTTIERINNDGNY